MIQTAAWKAAYDARVREAAMTPAAGVKKTSAWKEYWKAEGPKLGQFALQQIEAASKPKPDVPLRRGYVERVSVEAQSPIPQWVLWVGVAVAVGFFVMKGRRRG